MTAAHKFPMPTVSSDLTSSAACGKALTSEKKTACSGKCRAALSRQRQDGARRARHWEIRQLLEAALKRLEDGAP